MGTATWHTRLRRATRTGMRIAWRGVALTVASAWLAQNVEHGYGSYLRSEGDQKIGDALTTMASGSSIGRSTVIAFIDQWPRGTPPRISPSHRIEKPLLEAREDCAKLIGADTRVVQIDYCGWPMKCFRSVMASEAYYPIDATRSNTTFVGAVWLPRAPRRGWVDGVWVFPYRPVAGGAFVNTVFWGFACLGIERWIGLLRRQRRTHAGLCAGCGYPVDSASRCPECGMARTDPHAANPLESTVDRRVGFLRGILRGVGSCSVGGPTARRRRKSGPYFLFFCCFRRSAEGGRGLAPPARQQAVHAFILRPRAVRGRRTSTTSCTAPSCELLGLVKQSRSGFTVFSAGSRGTWVARSSRSTACPSMFTCWCGFRAILRSPISCGT